ncbi:MAG: pseudouridine synthase [Bdellovibrionaceae bacterium]|nr:pseudouridine synthase [Pseudobdellovibrionaceae bacterium]|tara:strand:- start:1959 stop:2756 length:798 start_codon:yes stop_codon:yes gene_type:complete
MPAERIQKIIAQAGLASRREAEVWIKEGRVTVNGRVSTLGDKADPAEDAIKVKGKLLTQPKATLVYYAFYKPSGVIGMMNIDRSGRRTLRDYFGKMKSKVFPIGRMPFLTEGLVLMTNDGDLGQKVQRSKKIVRIFEVKASGKQSQKEIEKLLKGSKIEGKLVQPLHAEISKMLTNKTKFKVAFEGMNSVDLKTLFMRCGMNIEQITLTHIGQINLKELTRGKYKRLKKSQFEALILQPELGHQFIKKAEVSSEKQSSSKSNLSR